MKKKTNELNQKEIKKEKGKINYKELFSTYKFLLIIPILLLFFFYRPQPEGMLTSLLDKLKLLLQLLIWPSLGVITGGILLTIFKNKGQLIIDDNQAFIEYCAKSNGAIFFGSIGRGKTALLAMLAHELPSANKYATFPC